ncbi:MAG: hypothetical protein HC814_05135 [Rhodobacteraceae bacterium]|nr:hypothetical protein [Paracoccaceae bacterium]
MKDSTRKLLAAELVILGTLLVVSLAVLFIGMQFNLLLTPKLTLPLLYFTRWVFWAVNQCRHRAELRPWFGVAVTTAPYRWSPPDWWFCSPTRCDRGP